jgi:hypothetical protein
MRFKDTNFLGQNAPPFKLWLVANLITIEVAQRLVAQALGHFRLVAVILAGIPKPHSNVRSRSLGQVACSHLLGILNILL